MNHGPLRGRSLRRIGLVLALSTVGMTTAAIGTASAATHPQKSAANTFIPIVAGGSSTGTQFLPMYVGEAKGWFAADHIPWTTDTFSGGDPTTMAAFSTGETNMLEGGVSDAVEYLLNGVIPANGGKFIEEMVGNSYDIDSVKSITSLQGLEGKTVGISGPDDGDWIYFAAMLKAYGIPANSVTYVTAGSTAARLAALQAGTVSAIAESSTDRTIVEGFGNVLVPANKDKVVIPTTSMFASTALLKHTKEMQDVIDVLAKATKWIRTNQIAGTAICEQYTGGTQAACSTGIQALVSGALKGGPYTWSNTGAVQTSAIAGTIKIEQALFPQYKVKLNVNKIVTTQYTGTSPTGSLP